MDPALIDDDSDAVSVYTLSEASVYLTPHASTVSLSTIGESSGSGDDVVNFFTDNDGRFFFQGLDAQQSSHQSLSRAVSGASVRSAATVASANTFITHGLLHTSLDDFCKVILSHRSLRKAQIVSSECYRERSGGILHRFLVLELYRKEKKPIYIRLDRRAGTSTFNLLLRRGSAPAKDTAQFSADKGPLIGKGQCENRQEFATVPTLMDFHNFVCMICRELITYTVWPENCYFFCSLIQEKLGADGHGQFVQGTLPHPDLAPGRRLLAKGETGMLHANRAPKPFVLQSIFVTTFTGAMIKNISQVFRPAAPANVTPGQMRLFKKTWREFDPARKGYIPRHQFVAFFSRLSGVFEVRIYSSEASVHEIIKKCHELTIKSGYPIWADEGMKGGMLNAASISRVLNSLDLSQSQQRRARYNRLYHEALATQEVGKGISFNNMLLLLARYTMIDAHKTLTADEIQRRESIDAHVADVVKLDRIRSMLRGLYQRRRFLTWKEEQRAEAASGFSDDSRGHQHLPPVTSSASSSLKLASGGRHMMYSLPPIPESEFE